MAEFALTKDGSTIDRILEADEKPPKFQLKPWHWLDVIRETGEVASTEIDLEAGEVTITETEPAAPPPRKVGTFIEFMEIFTPAEQLTIKAASQQSPALGLWYDKAIGRTEVDLTTAEMSDGLDALVSAGLINAARKTEILDWDFDA
jgi:hypothetical protein